MKYLLTLLTIISFLSLSKAQSKQVSTIDFVQILNDNKDETIFYYENNWKIMREWAMEEGVIAGYQLLEVPYSEDAPFHLMLITTYKDQKQYDKAEEKFQVLIERKGERKLLNEIQPGDFRKIVMSKSDVKQLF